MGNRFVSLPVKTKVLEDEAIPSAWLIFNAHAMTLFETQACTCHRNSYSLKGNRPTRRLRPQVSRLFNVHWRLLPLKAHTHAHDENSFLRLFSVRCSTAVFSAITFLREHGAALTPCVGATSLTASETGHLTTKS